MGKMKKIVIVHNAERISALLKDYPASHYLVQAFNKEDEADPVGQVVVGLENVPNLLAAESHYYKIQPIYPFTLVAERLNDIEIIFDPHLN